MIKFRQKDFSNYILKGAVAGAHIGGAIGGGLAHGGFIPMKMPKYVPGGGKYNEWVEYAISKGSKDGKSFPKYEEKDLYINGELKAKEGEPKYLRDWKGDKIPVLGQKQKIAFTVGSVILGAGLGALVGAVRTLGEKWNQSKTDRRLLQPLKRALNLVSLKEGVDYTFDPKLANEIPTKVCIVLSSASGDLQTVINSKNDPKLKRVVDKVVRQSPGRVKAGEESNRYNEITITTEKNTSNNVKQVVSIVKSFVESGYPVYIVEVG